VTRLIPHPRSGWARTGQRAGCRFDQVSIAFLWSVYGQPRRDEVEELLRRTAR
jgi:hypothetical protein